ncbi:amine dehydrogenase [Pseudomonas fluorescens]|jgi:methylamine dehydrogenase heavy chain|uniref:amine dehydrogenase large subunit n=1 Tax=Pseudomonas fluorescens TaxID=294 RepID=UPI00083D629A|nr:amine dehydrogenase large subunit [Pseudomonas fluorescens]AOE67884.1 amine dehydrogenase [Pseudomonas fluorescens]AOE73695.1 amine dehydrogenase [Pseudomonas fluorescens]
MRATRITVPSALGISLLVLGLNTANADLPADTIGNTVLAFPPEAHRAFIVDVEFESFVVGRVTVVDPDKKRVLGMVPTGFAAPSTLSHDQKTLYSADIFYSRGTRGTRTDVLTAWDSSTLSPAWEVLIPSKRAESLTQRYGLKTSADDRFVYVYNFTPSTSVTVVDTQAKTVTAELAIPGCVLNYPVGNRRFASLCGDGSLQVVTLNDQGQETARSRTAFFDPNAEKLNERAVNVGDTYYFTTTTGTVRPVDFSGDAPKILGSWTLTTEAEKQAGWAPGGWQLMAVAPKLNRLYVLMHDAHEPMKWEDPSPLIWAFDLKTHKKVATLEAPVPVWSLQATGDDKPLLLGADIEGGLQIFDLKTNKLNASMPKVAKTATQIMSY